MKSRAQHLTGIQILREICDGQLKGGNLKSKEIELIPNKIKSGRYVGDTHTAGFVFYCYFGLKLYTKILLLIRSICLLMQSCIPCLIFTDNICKLDLRGGTNADHAPPIDYYEYVCYYALFLRIEFQLS